MWHTSGFDNWCAAPPQQTDFLANPLAERRTMARHGASKVGS
jgi:hypothetical protein